MVKAFARHHFFFFCILLTHAFLILAYLHNAFILSTVHNAQSNTPPPSKHRLVGWAKRKRGKDGSLTADGDLDQDPRKRKLKSDVMALSKADRERLKALVKAGDKNKLRPYVDQLLGTRISRPPTLPVALSQLPPSKVFY